MFAKRNKETRDPVITRPRISRWSILILIVSLIGLYLLLPQVKQLSGSMAVLKHAEVGWVIAGLGMSALSFFAAAYTQFVAGNYIGSFKKITVLQLTGAFINHFLPFNLGSAGLTARYYRTLKKPSATAIALAAMPITFGTLMNVLVIALISPVTLRDVARHSLGNWFIYSVLAFVVAVLAAVWAIPKLRRRLITFTREAIDGFASLRLWPQLPSLIVGSLGLTVILSLALLCSVYASRSSISMIDAFTLFVTFAVVQNVTPTPGGIGGSEAFLVLGLTSIGMSLPHAVAATIIFRIVTFWVPILPGILALRQAGRWGLLEAKYKVNGRLG